MTETMVTRVTGPRSPEGIPEAAPALQAPPFSRAAEGKEGVTLHLYNNKANMLIRPDADEARAAREAGAGRRGRKAALECPGLRKELGHMTRRPAALAPLQPLQQMGALADTRSEHD